MNNLQKLRAMSLAEAERLGYSVNLNLPLLELGGRVRTVSDIATRMLCLDAVLAAACGLPSAKSIAWLEQEDLYDELSPQEAEFLQGGSTLKIEMQCKVESLFALSWAVGFVNELDFQEPCGPDLVTKFPDLNKMESSAGFPGRLRLRDESSIVAKLDVAYCLHWAIRDALVHNQRPPGRLHPTYVIERRRSLQWLVSEDAWDEVSLDT